MIGTYEFRHIQRKNSADSFNASPLAASLSLPLECRTKCVRMGTQRGRQELPLRVERRKEQKELLESDPSQAKSAPDSSLHFIPKTNNDE